ncbi:hypothetical protein QOZ80_3BG0290830 [Eleusine coracana subsp. coracana]|nr:hypothetical protein QOZ80_3BG0290830 [Eleusine coracana subsp. coracana]
MTASGGAFLVSFFDEVEAEEECTDLEPFFFDEAEAVAEHAAAEEKRRKKEQMEAREKELQDQRSQARMDALNRIRSYDRKSGPFTRFYYVDLSTFDLDEESPLGPMRYTETPIDMHETVNKPGRKRFLPCDSANIFSVKIASSVFTFPMEVYGTVIARDSLDLKCVYLFRRDVDDSQLINSTDESLILIGPKRGLALIGAIYFEIDLKIKRGQRSARLSKGFITLDGVPRSYMDKMLVERSSLTGQLSKVEVTFAVVKCAVEATIAIEVARGEFYGEISAFTTCIQDKLLLHDSKVAGVVTHDGKRVVQLLRPVMAVCLQEKLMVIAVARSGANITVKTIEFTPGVNGGAKGEITCGSVSLLVKVNWSIISKEWFR